MTGGAKLEEEARVDAGPNQKRLFCFQSDWKIHIVFGCCCRDFSLSFSSTQKLGG
jgi:hypothetical protein